MDSPKPERQSRRARAAEWLGARAPSVIDPALAAEAHSAHPDVPEKAWREVFLASGIPLDPLVEGVRQDSFDHLEGTLCRLAELYSSAAPQARAAIRSLVLTARQHAEWAARNPKATSEHRDEKGEMVLWMRTWLENPPLFPAWARLRDRTLGR